MLWDLKTGKVLSFGDFGACIAFSPNGKLLASGSYYMGNSIIIIRDVLNGKEIKRVTVDEGLIKSVAFSPDGTLLASGVLASHKAIRIWLVESGEEIKTLNDSDVKSLAFSPDGKILASGSTRGITFWKAEE